MTEKRKEKVRDTKLPAEQKRLEWKWFEPGFLLAKQEQSSRKEAEPNTQPELFECQLQPEIQRLYSEQERLRIEAEQVWLEQECHFAEQARLRIEAESADQQQYEAGIQQLIAKARFFEPERQLSEKEISDEIERAPITQFSNGLTQQPRLARVFLDASKQSVFSDVLSKEPIDLPFASPQNHRISRVLPAAALIFLMFGGAVLVFWFSQTSKMEEPNQTNLNQTESNQIESNRMRSNQTISSNFTSDPGLTAESTSKVNEVPPTTLSLKPFAKPVGKPSVVSKPFAPRMKKPMPRSRKRRPSQSNP